MRAQGGMFHFLTADSCLRFCILEDLLIAIRVARRPLFVPLPVFRVDARRAAQAPAPNNAYVRFVCRICMQISVQMLRNCHEIVRRRNLSTSLMSSFVTIVALDDSCRTTAISV